MNFKRRLEQLEAKAPAPPPRDGYPLLAPTIRELDKLIRRREEHIRTLENDPDNFHDGYDDALYGGEAIEEHASRVDTLLSALDERDEAWRREHRPDLVDTPNEIDDHIVEVEAEIRALKAEIRSSKPEGEGVGAIG